ncbi:hypothetical protein [Rhodococcus sp. NPDC057529]|uniref:hypothetical protein n=1 Tax=Rhodococcus sp. NPDC057529 TaxID=3346158 RepID=UPI00366FAAEE
MFDDVQGNLVERHVGVLVIGALVGGRFTLPKRVLAGMLAFAAGALITALTFELFEESYHQGGISRAALGLAAGAIVFTVLSQRLDRLAEGAHREPHGSEKLDGAASETGGIRALVCARDCLTGYMAGIVDGDGPPAVPGDVENEPRIRVGKRDILHSLNPGEPGDADRQFRRRLPLHRIDVGGVTVTLA